MSLIVDKVKSKSKVFASVFRDESESSQWTKLGDHNAYSQLRSKFWGKRIEVDAREWRNRNIMDIGPADDIGAECFALNLGIIDIQYSKLWVRQDYIRIYDHCVKRHARPPAIEGTAPSIVITGQPGIGVFQVITFALSNMPLFKKVKHIGSPMLSVVVLENRSHLFGFVVTSATYSSRMECTDKMLQASLSVTSCHSSGHLSMQMRTWLVFPQDSLTTQSYTLCLPPLQIETNGSL